MARTLDEDGIGVEEGRISIAAGKVEHSPPTVSSWVNGIEDSRTVNDWFLASTPPSQETRQAFGFVSLPISDLSYFSIRVEVLSRFGCTSLGTVYIPAHRQKYEITLRSGFPPPRVILSFVQS